MLYPVLILPVTLDDPKPPSQTIQISTVCIAFHIFIVGEHGDITFGVQVHHIKSHLTDNKLSLKDAWSCHMAHFFNF